MSDPRFVESGREGARRRWRTVRLDELDRDQARLVRALVAMARAANAAKATGSDPSTTT